MLSTSPAEREREWVRMKMKRVTAMWIKEWKSSHLDLRGCGRLWGCSGDSLCVTDPIHTHTGKWRTLCTWVKVWSCSKQILYLDTSKVWKQKRLLYSIYSLSVQGRIFWWTTRAYRDLPTCVHQATIWGMGTGQERKGKRRKEKKKRRGDERRGKEREKKG